MEKNLRKLRAFPAALCKIRFPLSGGGIRPIKLRGERAPACKHYKEKPESISFRAFWEIYQNVGSLATTAAQRGQRVGWDGS